MGRAGGCEVGGPRGRRALARCGLWLVLLGHAGLVLGAIVHGAVLRHVARPTRARSTQHEYTTANVVAVTSGLLSIGTGIVAILVSRNLLRAALHWALLGVALLNGLLSAACSLGLALAVSLTVASRGTHLVAGCNSSDLPADARIAFATNDCPFDTTRIYDTALALWLPTMAVAAAEAVLSGRCCVVALILRGIGPCAPACVQEQLDEAAVERMETTSVPADLPRRETHRLLPARAEAEHQAEARV
ncbi:keratinocyte-associated protein 3 isoform X2 [Alligator mississippiensis]|uniref:keratinocyte-associated protein 3 isoform X2 n=1 Tax=Alligator mississippiensis TaxID=8496 RepID=UPI002877D3A7|nr:keratinocyte-associated protein 3 isoform X2 [Alligator mississippiensis]